MIDQPAHMNGPSKTPLYPIDPRPNNEILDCEPQKQLAFINVVGAHTVPGKINERESASLGTG